MHKTLTIFTLWHPTYAGGAYSTPVQYSPLPEGSTRGDAVLGGEVIYLAAALSALGRTYVQAVAPLIPEAPQRGLAQVWSRLRAVMLPQESPAGVPGCVDDAVRSFGRAGIGANHLCDPAVLEVAAQDPVDAFYRGLGAAECVRPDVVCVGPECGLGDDLSIVHQLQQSGIPVMVAPPGYPGSPTGIRRVTCTVDGSAHARRALRHATDMALALDAEVRVSTTTPPPVEDEETLVRPEPVSTPLLDEGCALVNEWSDWEVIATPDGDWSMKNAESSAEARWLPEEILVFGHRPEKREATQWKAACNRFSIPYMLVD